MKLSWVFFLVPVVFGCMYMPLTVCGSLVRPCKFAIRGSSRGYGVVVLAVLLNETRCAHTRS